MNTYVDVAIPVGVRRTFAYSVPHFLDDRIGVGQCVLVPFGRKIVSGFVVGCSREPPIGGFRIRAVRDVLDGEKAIPPDLIALALWVADYYFTAPGEVLRALVPAGSIAASERKLGLSASTLNLIRGGLQPGGLQGKEALILETLAHTGELSLEQLSFQPRLHDAGRWVDGLAERGYIQFVDSMPRAIVGRKSQLGVRACDSNPDACAQLTKAQRDLYLKLQALGGTVSLQSAIKQGTSLSIARALEKKGFVEIRPMRVERIPWELSDAGSRKVVVFTEAQRAAFEKLRTLLKQAGSARCLLYGVTGSGKTEIYLKLIAHVLENGGSAMLLVPEIGLTPMLGRIAASHFPDRVALLHSGMSPGERFDQWQRIHSGDAQVVVGTRSAVFAPLEKLQLIVMDEEQDASYKQDEAPCYHAREVAWQRLQRQGGVLLMGSATPSVEAYHSAQDDSSILRLVLPERIEARPMPEVTVVDMSLEFQRHGKKTVISEKLRWELEENVRRGEQSIVLLNRRGFSRSLLCRSCGNVLSCPNCSISMTYHLNEDRLICHYCALEREVPSSCERCGGQYIYFVGVGTEQLEQIVRGILPEARLARVDRDTTRRKGSLRKVLFDFAARRLDVLVGTQMIAKGHDFPDVTLVGVVAADAGLAFPDFRSAERTFQLLTQVAGRAGRGTIPGRVVIQSFYPDHYALRYARNQDYPGFYKHEIEFRQLLGYPPVRKLVQILISDDDAAKGMHVGLRIAEEIKLSTMRHGLKTSLQVLGPAAAPLEKLRGQYRFQVLLKAVSGTNMSAILQDAFASLTAHKVSLKRVKVDVDPLSLL